MSNNPLIELKRVGKYGAIPFNEITQEHFLPAIEHGLQEAEAKLETIKNNPDKANYDNTLRAMQELSEVSDIASTVYFNLMSCESDDEFKQLAQEIAPKLSLFSSKMISDPILFERVKSVYERRETIGLTSQQRRLVEKQYRGFIRNGALLSDEDKQKLQEIDVELSQLGPKFGQNVLGATNAWEKHVIDAEAVAGIPENALKAAAFRARQKGYKEGWLFNLQIPSVLPVLTYCSNRALRKDVNSAYSSRAYKDDFDNQEILKRISCLRYKRAELLGYKSHAEIVLEERMAQTPETVMSFLDRLYDASIEPAKMELAEMHAFARELDGIEKMKPWDLIYYAEKLKQLKFDYNAEELRPYFKMENVVSGIFKVAEKLYGIRFNSVDDVPRYHEDVQVFEVTEADESYIGLLYLDLFPRETKRGGAWMTTFQTQGYSYGKDRQPHVSIVTNFTPSTEDTPSLLSLDEVTTLFHEFGHSLHGLLSNVNEAALASPNVYWDFVELPSQIMENWATEKETLALFAYHYETGELIPDDLIEKVKKSKSFNAGSNSLRQIGLSLLDMAWHNGNTCDIEDVYTYEKKAIAKTSLLPPLAGRNTSCSYSHVFAGGYSSGYYSYKWAEVLEADAFQLFLEKGIFDSDTAAAFRKNVLAAGNTEEPMDLFVKFRGRKPDPDALLKRVGLK
ncbi:MAG: M3 family metallopeptidase [Candidatus Cloacimonetes bacterium]|nr:M3 family metallopeptidase [Candidatus Cloacimonadota bacterium]